MKNRSNKLNRVVEAEMVPSQTKEPCVVLNWQRSHEIVNNIWRRLLQRNRTELSNKNSLDPRCPRSCSLRPKTHCPCSCSRCFLVKMKDPIKDGPGNCTSPQCVLPEFTLPLCPSFTEVQLNVDYAIWVNMVLVLHVNQNPL